jgi:hypothetical protein
MRVRLGAVRLKWNLKMLRLALAALSCCTIISFANAEEFYVVKNPATHRCRVVTQPPRNERVAIFGGMPFSSEQEAFEWMRTSSPCQENGIEGAAKKRTAGEMARPPLL